MYKFKSTLFSLFLSVTSACYAGPWLMAGNLGEKSDIDLLADYGLIKAPVMSWPIAWQNIEPSLTSPNSQALLKTAPASVKQAYQDIQALYKTQAKLDTVNTSITADGGSNINPFPTFANRPRSNFGAGIATGYQTTHFAGNLALSYGRYNDLNRYVHLDGSYLDYFFGNWSIGFDKINRWWGPGYSDSMILSENAVPRPALTLQRMRAYPFETKWLSWLGPWSLTTSLSKLNPDRAIPSPFDWFTNLSFRPVNSLQVSFSRDVMFSGDGRPLNWTMMKNVILGGHTCGAPDHTEEYCTYNFALKQHYDLSLKWSLYQGWKIPLALYLDTSFNDKTPRGHQIKPLTDPIPAKTAFLFGANTWTETNAGFLRIYTEYEYNIQNIWYFWGGNGGDNIYGAGGYPYTYYGNIIATPLGSEGIGYTIGGILNEKNTNNNDSFTLRFLRINPYNKAGIGYPYAKQNILWASIGRSFSLPKQLGDLTAKLGYLYALQTGQNRLNSSPSLALTWTKNFY